MERMTKGTIEAEIANAITRFHREQQGRGPTDVRAHLIGDMVLVRCSGILTPTEVHLSASDDGRKLIVSSRQELRSINRPEAEEIVASIVKCSVLRSYADVDVEAAEQVEVYVLAVDAEKHLTKHLK